MKMPSLIEILAGILKGMLDVLPSSLFPFIIVMIVLVVLFKVLLIISKLSRRKKRNNYQRRNEYSKYERHLMRNDFLKENHEYTQSGELSSAPPLCPRCGTVMVMRTRKIDGKKFYGCKAFPKCRGVVNIG